MVAWSLFITRPAPGTGPGLRVGEDVVFVEAEVRRAAEQVQEDQPERGLARLAPARYHQEESGPSDELQRNAPVLLAANVKCLRGAKLRRGIGGDRQERLERLRDLTAGE